MNSTKTIRSIAGAAIAAGAMLFMTMPGSAAHAEEARDTTNNLKQMGLAFQSSDASSDGDVDGRDFLVWQRGNSGSPISTGDLADWQSNYGVGASATEGGDYNVWRDNFGRTGATSGDTGQHEVGHWMGLYHTFP